MTVDGASSTDGKGVATGAGSERGGRARQISLARIAEFGIRPKHDLGQNFLVDDNIIRIILAQLQAGPDDVALEVGAGLGVLTAALAGATAHVHAFEIDRSLEPSLRATLVADGRARRVSLHFEDILRADLTALRPRPTVCASNLPYSAAGPFLVDALRGLPSVRRYSVMVQREVADRMAAPPGNKTYGTLSVWVGLYAVIVDIRPLSRNIFYPRPRVDSSLVTMVRREPSELPRIDHTVLARVIQAAFGQRRKTLVNALSAGLDLSRNDVVRAVEELGLPVDVRAERVPPGRFTTLAARLL